MLTPLVLLAHLWLVADAGSAGAPSAGSGEDAFQALGTLVGSWSGTVAEGKQVQVSYELISGGSALVESYVSASGRKTMTVFHRDGLRVLATHYCARGNQPRLRLSRRPSSSSWIFEFMDATNLTAPGASHLTRLELVSLDASHLRRLETYREGARDETTTLSLTRAK